MWNDIILEQNTKSKPILVENIQRYLSKVNASCKLITGSGSGFFCKINFENFSKIFLFTNNHILNENLIKPNSEIQIKYKNEIKVIKMNNRFSCTNEELDYTCIEIFVSEDFKDYFEIDLSEIKKYKYELLVCFQFPEGNDISLAEGKLIDIIDNCQIIHTITTDFGSSGSPIVLSNNLKVIGIHRGRFQSHDFNRGVLIKNVLNDIKLQIKQKNYVFPYFNLISYFKTPNNLEEEIELLKRFNEDFNFLDSLSIKLLIPKSYNEIEGYVKAPENSLYKNGIFKFKILFPIEYPYRPPKLLFLTKITHVNISEDGYVCVKYLVQWEKKYNLLGLLSVIYEIFVLENPHSPFDMQLARILRSNPLEYEKICNDYIDKYALKEFPRNEKYLFQENKSNKFSTFVAINIVDKTYFQFNNIMTLNQVLQSIQNEMDINSNKFNIVINKKVFCSPFNINEDLKIFSNLFMIPQTWC